MLSELVICIFQTTVMLLLAMVVFGGYVHPNINLGIVFLIPIIFCFSILGLGLILASIAKTESSAGGLSWLVILPLQFMGGVFSYGMDTPGGEFIPTTYAVHAMRLTITSGLSWDAIYMDLLFMGIFGIVATIIGILIFQKKTSIR